MILGTSILENSSAKEASQKLGGSFVNLSLEGSNFYERSFVLRYALEKKHISRVLYSLDHLGVASYEGHPGYPIETWAFLYDDDPLNDIRIYLNDKYMKCLRSFSHSDSCLGRDVGLDRPNAWFALPMHAARFGGLAHWFRADEQPQVKEALQTLHKRLEKIIEGESVATAGVNERLAASKAYLDKTLLSLIAQHPETRFDLILPPYSRIVFAMEAQYDKATFQVYKESIRYLVAKSQEYPNLRLYGWGDHDFLDAIENYKDLYHFSPAINSWMLDAIRTDEGHLTPEYLESYLAEITKRAESYDLEELKRRFDHYLEVQKGSQ
jgi:hypothetical protein